jgi:hypothetical protein
MGGDRVYSRESIFTFFLPLSFSSLALASQPMSILPTLLRSLFLTIVISFVVPIVLISGVLAFVCVIGYIPGLAMISQTGAADMCQLLATFGGGSPIEGVIVIGLTFSLVGALFDTYNFYSYQHSNNH